MKRVEELIRKQEINFKTKCLKISMKETNCYKCKKIIKIGEEVYRSVGKWGFSMTSPENPPKPEPIYHYLCAQCFNKLNDSERTAWKKFEGNEFTF